MTAADWGILVPAIAAFLFGAAAWLKSRATQKQVQSHVHWHDQGPQS